MIDDDGNAVSVSSTIERLWSTGLMVPGFGFMLNNQPTSFNDAPRASSAPYDPGANDVAPGKRPRASISPMMLFLDGELVAAYGSPGRTGIIGALPQVTLNLIDHRRSLQSSIAAPRIALSSASSLADTEIEAGFGGSVRAALERLGYAFVDVRDIGAVQAVVTYPLSGIRWRRRPAADRRGRRPAVSARRRGIGDPAMPGARDLEVHLRARRRPWPRRRAGAGAAPRRGHHRVRSAPDLRDRRRASTSRSRA
ncbi:gamma-glutamyltransferase [Nannocystis pusilla]|uniref:gamma-glutamyltransferase n=1 Tax=Nannocystis pusilla TaxID=889268 RepID=UPI003B82F621